jgi:hypothetical protein
VNKRGVCLMVVTVRSAVTVGWLFLFPVHVVFGLGFFAMPPAHGMSGSVSWRDRLSQSNGTGHVQPV